MVWLCFLLVFVCCWVVILLACHVSQVALTKHNRLWHESGGARRFLAYCAVCKQVGLLGSIMHGPGSSELKLKVGKPLLALTPHKNFIV